MGDLLRSQLQLLPQLPARHHWNRGRWTRSPPTGATLPTWGHGRVWRHLWSPYLLGQAGEVLVCAQRSAHRDILGANGDAWLWSPVSAQRGIEAGTAAPRTAWPQLQGG